MTQNRRLLFFVYDGFDLLATSGTIGVFAAASDLAGDNRYETCLISLAGGEILCNAGFPVVTQRAEDLVLNDADSLFIAGASTEKNLRRTLKDKAALRWIGAAAPRMERFGSVCTGSFLLAAAGLLSGKHVVTHWQGCSDLAKYYPSAAVEADALYVVDGKIWTSAGVTTGIDMALAILERDGGTALMGAVARQLVVYAHRPGNQSQFSTVLDAQLTADGRFSNVILWIEEHLDTPLKVSDMAENAGMTERSFYRKFTQATGITPSKYLENARLKKARELLEKNLPIKQVSHDVGFRSEAGFRAAFTARFGVSPSLHRKMQARTEGQQII